MLWTVVKTILIAAGLTVAALPVLYLVVWFPLRLLAHSVPRDLSVKRSSLDWEPAMRDKFMLIEVAPSGHHRWEWHIRWLDTGRLDPSDSLCSRWEGPAWTRRGAVRIAKNAAEWLDCDRAGIPTSSCPSW